ncbi:hypothetical protein N7530_012902 [Penicillium desertorum]|uniref:Uncharacterized protein n=1 Tax=Penicillium desertorum TaxID=1303715 RepID=A0A9X0BFH6_9EURO|nr:hypothetical protein N7530_012902 [Penicillium desertorum]
MRPRANWPVCPPEPTAAPPITSPAPSPTPPCRGLALYGPPPKPPVPGPPGKVAPFDPPFPPSRSANWRIRKIAISSAPSRGASSPTPPGGGGLLRSPPPPSKAEGAPPCVHPGPRASRAGFASPSTSPALHPARRCGQLPPPRQLAPHAPFPGPRSTAGRPRPGLGGGTAGGAWLRGDRRAGGSYREGHPARAPTVRSPAMPASLTQRNAATLADPHSLSPGPLGPGRFYTDSPTPFGV